MPKGNLAKLRFMPLKWKRSFANRRKQGWVVKGRRSLGNKVEQSRKISGGYALKEGASLFKCPSRNNRSRKKVSGEIDDTKAGVDSQIQWLWEEFNSARSENAWL